MDTVVLNFPTDPKPWLDALITYNSFFLSKYVGNDIQNLCGSLFDTPLAKTVILFFVIYSGSRNVSVSLLITVATLVLQWYMSRYEQCKPYVERDHKSDMSKNVWVSPSASFIATSAPSSGCGQGMCSIN